MQYLSLLISGPTYPVNRPSEPPGWFARKAHQAQAEARLDEDRQDHGHTSSSAASALESSQQHERGMEEDSVPPLAGSMERLADLNIDLVEGAYPDVRISADVRATDGYSTILGFL